MCRTYNVIGVMNNSNKWSGCTVVNNKISIKLHEKAIFKKSGLIKKMYRSRISDNPTISQCIWLYNHGCEITVA